MKPDRFGADFLFLFCLLSSSSLVVVCLPKSINSIDNDLFDPASVGTCLRMRLNNGNCLGIYPNITSRQQCCQVRGFFIDRLIDENEKFNNHLASREGSPDCVDACEIGYQPTCDRFHCSADQECRLSPEDNQPHCVCKVLCEDGDDQESPICTMQGRRFASKCHYRRARCRANLLDPGSSSFNTQYTVIPCLDSPEYPTCNPVSYYKPLAVVNGQHDSLLWEGAEGDPRLFDTLWSPMHWFKVRHSGPYHQQSVVSMTRRRRNSLPRRRRLWNPFSSLFGSQEDGSCPLHSKRRNQLTCPRGTYCLLRQFDGLPACDQLPEFVVDHDGVRRCAESSDDLDWPMCGSDDRTYFDACQLKLASLEKGIEIRLAYQGPCRADATCSNVECPKQGWTCLPSVDGPPICSDCRRLPIDCNSHELNVNGHRRLWLRSTSATLSRTHNEWDRNSTFGLPEWPLATRTSRWPPVCRSDGQAETNACFLHVVSCLSRKAFNLRKPRFCIDRYTDEP